MTPEQPVSNAIYPQEEFLLATYTVSIEPSDDPNSIIQLIAGHFYPGTGSRLSGTQDALREKYAGRILSIDEIREQDNMPQSNTRMRNYISRIAIPLTSLEPSIAMLVTATAGEALALGDIRLTELQLPDRYLNNFAGPKFGIRGIRELLNIPKRPLLLAIIKPSLGLSPTEGAHIISQAAIGGADIIKDDELLANPSYCQRSERVALFVKALEEIYQQTGEKTLYAVNITDRTEQLVPNAIEAIELGAEALMINYLQVGYDAARMVCENPNITVPVLGHNAGASALYMCGNTGMSIQIVNGLLPRLCGLDLCIFLTPYGKFQSSSEQCRHLANTMRMPLPGIRSTVPIAAGGVSPALVGTLCSDYGLDIAIGVGGAIFGHPEGAEAGAKAFREAINSALQSYNSG